MYCYYDIPVSILVISVFVFSLLLVLGSYYLRFQYFIPSVNNLREDKKCITLTFDDGPNELVTSKLLDILKKHEVKAMFFCIGKHIQSNYSLAKQIVNEGHVLGNHTYCHKNTFALSHYKVVKNELKRTNELIESITLQKNIYFRPPFGVTNPIIANAVTSESLQVIGWSLRSLDTVLSPEKLLSKLKRKVKGNDIILLHELESTLKVVDEFIVYAKIEGYSFVLPEIKNK